ncbi:Bestrophin, RFP-TM, chloride channel-domain-containing protein [Mycena olivaceomarginata]|nr:Bestrophin, RFP-TM, chloride channel-domain-containing protein [Mycena olivaceomarginata]
MSTRRVNGKRSFTGNHPLLPAARPAAPPFIPKVPTYAFLKWTFGRGSVADVLKPPPDMEDLARGPAAHALCVGHRLRVRCHREDDPDPNVMLTVMGVVIGFVISYRAMSGYDRYWMGRTAWTDVIRNARTMARLIWYHEMGKVMAEKRMALDLVEATTLRGELGIYYEDLYDLVRPLHDFTDPENPRPDRRVGGSSTSGCGCSLPAAGPGCCIRLELGRLRLNFDLDIQHKQPPRPRPPRRAGHASQTSLHQPLLPASNPAPEDGVLRRVSPDVIPFAGVLTGVGAWVRGVWGARKDDMGRHRVRGVDRSSRMRTWTGPIHPQGVAQLEEFEKGENLPEEVLRCLSEWVSVLEERGTVPGTSLGSILAGIQQFEISLTMLEHILTTPLPFVYSVHIRVVWLYLFLLPLQLVNDFVWHTVPAVSLGAFVYLGFVAAGEEIEQPFGYDDNDLDLDMFCRDIIRQDIRCLKKAPCLNAWFAPKPLITGPHGQANGNGTPQNGALLSPETTSASATSTALDAAAGLGSVGAGAGTGTAAGLHAYGGNMYRASLASLSDSASLVSEVENEDEDEEGQNSEEDATGNETETETEGEANTRRVEEGVREGELVDVR